jgi:DNA-binding NarL/FixJ family response regulator
MSRLCQNPQVDQQLREFLRPLFEYAIIDDHEKTQLLDRLLRFTPQEQKVFFMICRGLMHQQIAEELFLSSSSVREYIRRVSWKLGYNSMRQVQAQVLALVAGLDRPAEASANPFPPSAALPDDNQ